jgi:hypothetical protein
MRDPDIGLSLYRIVRRAPPQRLSASEWPWLAGAILSGGVVGPLLADAWPHALAGIERKSLLLKRRGDCSPPLLGLVSSFARTSDVRIALGMLAIVAGALVLGWPAQGRFTDAMPALFDPQAPASRGPSTTHLTRKDVSRGCDVDRSGSKACPPAA